MDPRFPASLLDELDRLIQDKDFDVHFQPIVNIVQASILGYEALIRAPATTALHSPLVLFEVAAQCGRLLELESLVAALIVRRFAELALPGRLFLNVTADTLSAAGGQLATVKSQLEMAGLAAERVVVELTETRPVTDLGEMSDAIVALRSLGLQIALDDLGEGFASLKRWVDLNPDFVKIDRHFVDGIAINPVKQKFVSSILEMAATGGTQVIAEGIEQWADLEVILRLGVSLCQGYLLARPSPAPRRDLRGDVLNQLLACKDEPARSGTRSGAARSARALLRWAPTLTLAATCAEAAALFKADPTCNAIPVLDHAERPLGLLRALTVFSSLSERYFLDLHGRKSCELLMERSLLCFDAGASLHAMAEAISSLDDRALVDGFVVTEAGRFLGMGRVSDLLRAISEADRAGAGYANPLTRLPGNIAVDQRLSLLLEAAQPFAVCYWNIRRFKPFNEAYGEDRGDQLLLRTAAVLREITQQTGDFVGHVGSDHFVTIHGDTDWEAACRRACREFDQALVELVGAGTVPEEHMTLKSRTGATVTMRQPILIGAVIRVGPFSVVSLRQLTMAMAETRTFAKQTLEHSGVVVERRTTANLKIKRSGPFSLPAQS